MFGTFQHCSSMNTQQCDMEDYLFVIYRKWKVLYCQQKDTLTEAVQDVDHFIAFGGSLTAETKSSQFSISFLFHFSIYYLKHTYALSFN